MLALAFGAGGAEEGFAGGLGEGLQMVFEVRAEVGGQPGARSNDATTGLDNASRKGGHEERILQQYKRHHLANTPGSRFLSGLYSETWTSGFLSGFLYR